MKYPRVFCYSVFLLILVFSGCSTGEKTEKLIEIHGATMGTTYMIKLVPGDAPMQENDVKSGIEKVLRQINRQMSVFDPQSEISQFNRSLDSSWFKVSGSLASVVHNALEVSRISKGAFDVTAAPLIDLWGFGPRSKEDAVPSPVEIEKARSCTGYGKMEVSLNPPGLKKKMACVICNLSAIAKGYGVDQVALYLEKAGIRRYLVEIGGEIRVSGKNHFNRQWRVGIATPDGSFGVHRAIPLENESMATSGDYFNFFEREGIRYSHTIDPRTGAPVKHNLASVTVIHQSCMMADAYATAIQVMGPEMGFSWAVKHHLAVLMLIRDNDSLIERATESFLKYIY